MFFYQVFHVLIHHWTAQSQQVSTHHHDGKHFHSFHDDTQDQLNELSIAKVNSAFGKKNCVSKQLWQCSPPDLRSHTLSHVYYLSTRWQRIFSHICSLNLSTQLGRRGREVMVLALWVPAQHAASSGKNPLLKSSQDQRCSQHTRIPRAAAGIARTVSTGSCLSSQHREWVWQCKPGHGQRTATASTLLSDIHKNNHVLPVTIWTRPARICADLKPHRQLWN